MIYLILLGLLFFIQLLTASWYDLAKKTTDAEKSFRHKMICSAICVAAGLLCSAIAGIFTIYPLLFLIAIAFLFLHDIIEEKQSKFAEKFACALCFIAYLIIGFALSIENEKLFGNRLLSPQISLVILIAVAVICTLLLLKLPKVSQFPSIVYVLVCAVSFGTNLQHSADAKMQAASCAIVLGSVALTISSVLNAFDKQNKKSLLRINLYYFGLMFISCSVAVL